MFYFNDLLNTALYNDNPFMGTGAPEGVTSSRGLQRMVYVATPEAKSEGKCGTSLVLQVIKTGLCQAACVALLLDLLARCVSARFVLKLAKRRKPRLSLIPMCVCLASMQTPCGRPKLSGGLYYFLTLVRLGCSSVLFYGSLVGKIQDNQTYLCENRCVAYRCNDAQGKKKTFSARLGLSEPLPSRELKRIRKSLS